MVFFAEASGIGALGLNWQSFLFQLISFVIVLLILRQFAFKKLMATLEARRNAVEDSLRNATQTEEKLQKTQQQIAAMLQEARKEAEDIVAAGHKQSASVIEAAETKAAERAEYLIREANTQIQAEITKAREALKAETLQLVSLATAKIIKQKLDSRKDADLINDALADARSNLHG